ncbi:MAG: hypothetical protein HQK65_07400 [Desulfamplus sp.]|nr:hypothetical protein [Desulfamplus sp.]
MKKCSFFNVFVLVVLVSFCGMVQAGVPRDGLVAEYLFGGNANDSSGNGNHGAVNGATLTTDRFGNSNSAYNFDGVNDYCIVKAKN